MDAAPQMSATEARSALAPMLVLVRRFAELDAVLEAAEVAEGQYAGRMQALEALEGDIAGLEKTWRAQNDEHDTWMEERHREREAVMVELAQHQQAAADAREVAAHMENLRAQVAAAERQLVALAAKRAEYEAWLEQVGVEAMAREHAATGKVQDAERRLARIEQRVQALRDVVALAEDEA